MYNQDIVRNVMAGDLDAFSKMYNDCAPAVYRRAYSLLDDPVLARETVRNVFRDIRKHIQSLPDPRDFDEWVFRLVNMHVNQLKSSRQQLWDEPDLRSVWDEITAEDGTAPAGQTPESIIETLSHMRKEEEARQNQAAGFHTPSPDAVSLSGNPNYAPFQETTQDRTTIFNLDGTEEWEPILFPPEEGGGRGAAELPLEGIPEEAQISSTIMPGVDADQPSPDQEADQTPQLSEEDVLLPLTPDPPKKSGARKRKRIRYEAARASAHFSVERVPYDYIPYEETSQEAYERVTLDETPRAVYEHIPYERPAKEDLVNIDKPEVSYTTIPYEAEIKREVLMYDNQATEASPPFDGAPAQTMDRDDQAELPNAPSKEVDNAANTLSHEWQDVDPTKVDVDQVLQEIVAEVDGVQIEQRGVNIIKEDERAPQMALEEKPVAVISQETLAEPIAFTPEATAIPYTEQDVLPTPEIPPVPKEELTTSVVEQTALKKGENEAEATSHPQDASAEEPQSKKRSWLAGAGFFVGAVAILLGILVLGHYLGLW